MKLSELIKTAKKSLEMYGDAEVYFDSDLDLPDAEDIPVGCLTVLTNPETGKAIDYTLTDSDGIGSGE